MKPQETKFEFVYNEIKQCILDGQIPHGNALPSSRMYCEQFHVSRYTINRVFEALRAEGLVDIQPRLAPIVVSKKDTCSSSNIVLEILKQKESILQVYQTFALILPSLMVFALQGCDVEIMPHYKQAMKALRLGYASGGWSSPSKLGYVILSETNHLLEWGHHFAYYPSKRHTLSHLNKKAITALRQLCEGNASSFADGMADCYRYILICMKKIPMNYSLKTFPPRR